MVELLEFTCGSCEAVNRLKFEKILTLSESPNCGKCRQPLLRRLHEPLVGLHSSSYQHDLDRDALDALKKVPGTSTFLKWLIKQAYEKEFRLEHHANCIKATERQAPSLYRMLRVAAERLGVSNVPDLFIYQSPEPNAYTFGVEEYFIAVSTSYVELLTDDEMLGVLGHELGHVQADHVLYKSAARVLTQMVRFGAVMQFGGIGALLLKPLDVALRRWDRASELTADRAKLLVVRKPMVVLTQLMKSAGGSPKLLAELDVHAFIEQAEQFEKQRDENTWSQILVFLSEWSRTHPFSVYRAKELLAFCGSGAFLEILDGDYTTTAMVQTSPCPRCGKPLQQTAVVCPHCAFGEEEDLKAAEEKARAEEESLGQRVDKGWDEARDWFKRAFSSDGRD